MKTVLRLLPIDFYDIACTENYFAHMALHGLQIKKIGVFAHFERCEPQNVKYRLEPILKDESSPAEDTREYFANCGWEYIFSVAKMFHIYKSTKENPQEIHTDPIVQSYTFDYINKKLKWVAVITVLLYAFSIGMILFASLGHPSPMRYLVENGQSTYMFSMLFLSVYVSYIVVQNWLKVKKLRLFLGRGGDMEHEKPFKKNYAPHIVNFVVILLGVCMIAMSFYKISARWDMELEAYTGSNPAVSLELLENDPNFARERYVIEGRDWANHISYDWSDLADIYKVTENGKVTGKRWYDDSGEYSPTVETTLYMLRFGFLSKPMFDDLFRACLASFNSRQIAV